jgi:class 3 adenylate cyclase
VIVTGGRGSASGSTRGTAVIASVGSEDQRSFSAIGDTTNVAARLQAIAAPGGIVIGAPTKEQLGDRARVEPLGPVELRGKSRPVEVYRLLGVDAEPV